MLFQLHQRSVLHLWCDRGATRMEISTARVIYGHILISYDRLHVVIYMWSSTDSFRIASVQKEIAFDACFEVAQQGQARLLPHVFLPLGRAAMMLCQCPLVCQFLESHSEVGGIHNVCRVTSAGSLLSFLLPSFIGSVLQGTSCISTGR